MRDKQEVFTADEVCEILIEHGQHDERFKLGEIIKYSPSEVLGILRKRTNGDRIRSMTDEELADFITDIPNNCGAISCLGCNFNLYDKGCAAYSKKAAVIWLKQEVQKDAES